jgi:hypothetical protein
MGAVTVAAQVGAAACEDRRPGDLRTRRVTPRPEQVSRPGVRVDMHPPEYYRELAQRARRLAGMVHQSDVKRALLKAAKDFDEIAEDLEAGAEVRHPELMPNCDR